jgi:hypothetical protein
MLWLIAMAATLVGGYAFFLSHIVGEIPGSWPTGPINRHDEPERFEFWQDVSGGMFGFGLLLALIATILQ